MMKLAIIFTIFLFSINVPSSYAKREIEMNKDSEIIQLELAQSKTTKSGLKIKYVNNGIESYQPFRGNKKTSAPASTLKKYNLRLSFEASSKDIELSYGIGMVDNNSEEFNGFEITYIEEKLDKGKSSILLKVEKIMKTPEKINK